MAHDVKRNITFFDGKGKPKFIEFPIVVDDNCYYRVIWRYYSELRAEEIESNLEISPGYFTHTAIEVNAGDSVQEGYFYYQTMMPEMDEYLINAAKSKNGNLLISSNDTNPVGVCIEYFPTHAVYHNIVPADNS